MNILCVIGQLGNGGTERQLYRFLELLDVERYSASVFVVSESGGVWKDRIESDLGVDVRFAGGGCVLSKVLAYRRVLSEIRPDVVFSWSFFTNVLSSFSKGILFVGSLRQEYARERVELGYIRRRLSLSPRRLVVNSSHVAGELVEAGVSRDRIHTIFNIFQRGVCFADPASASLARAEARGKYGIPDDAVVVAGVGRDSPTKDFDFFIDTVEALGSELDMRKVLVLLLGSGGTAAKDRIAEKGLSKYFILPGEVPDAHRDLAAADVFFLSSRQEGMPNVLIEAIDAGCAVLTTDVGGVGDILAPLPEKLLDKTLLRERNAEKAACMLKELLIDSELRCEFRKYAAKILERFAPENIMPLYYRAIEGKF